MKVVDVPSLARFILSDACQSIVVLTGAGISVASGIPDFRSPGGMYDSLRPDLLTASQADRKAMQRDPTHVLSWQLFQHNQFPYLEVRRPFILGTLKEQKWKATLAHRFIELLHTKTNKLTRLYTQNIDGLDQQCRNIPADKIIAVHGSLAQVACEGCNTPIDVNLFCERVEKQIRDIYGTDKDAPTQSTPIFCNNCQKALVKPTTVLFGRSLPRRFFEYAPKDLFGGGGGSNKSKGSVCDLLLIIGTSLAVSPANSLAYNVSPDCKRVVINLEPVGQEFGLNFYNNDNDDDSRDLFLQGTCDEICWQLAQELKWTDDLYAMADKLPTASQTLLSSSDQHQSYEQ